MIFGMLEVIFKRWLKNSQKSVWFAQECEKCAGAKRDCRMVSIVGRSVKFFFIVSTLILKLKDHKIYI